MIPSITYMWQCVHTYLCMCGFAQVAKLKETFATDHEEPMPIKVDDNGQ